MAPRVSSMALRCHTRRRAGAAHHSMWRAKHWPLLAQPMHRYNASDSIENKSLCLLNACLWSKVGLCQKQAFAVSSFRLVTLPKKLGHTGWKLYSFATNLGTSLKFGVYGNMRKRTRVVPQYRLHCYGTVPASHSVDSYETARCRSVQFRQVWDHVSAFP